MATDRAHAFTLLVILALSLPNGRKGPSAGLTIGAASFACGSRHTEWAQTGGRSWCSLHPTEKLRTVLCLTPLAQTGGRSWWSLQHVTEHLYTFIRSWQCD